MTEKDSEANKATQEALSILGLDPNASFDEIQDARNEKLAQAGEDPLIKAKIEASYDLLLMNSLKARRLGKISSEAVNASQKEEVIVDMNSGLGNVLRTRLKSITSSLPNSNDNSSENAINLPNGSGLTIRISLGILTLVLLLVAPDQNIQFILSIATIGLFISQIKRGRRVIQSLGWSVVFLSSGLILGGLVVSGISDQSLLVSLAKIEALPAVFLLWIGSLILS
ncbi:CPP1-like family protein [Prochlorococcus marinus]|uniref:CPP1-like family protein n=1 Tax=Prochlorococcus marinus TaxID=1219 RepID=UPI0022B35D63|nr:CPP1-like family protein [Prochlorococcus marinus]